MAGRVVHVEIGAADTDRAQSFYSGVFGWEIGPPMSPEMDYRMFQTGENEGGAITAAGKPGNFTVYLDTDDIDASLAKVARARRHGRREDAGAGPRLVRRVPATPRATRSASGRATAPPAR